VCVYTDARQLCVCVTVCVCKTGRPLPQSQAGDDEPSCDVKELLRRADEWWVTNR